MDIQGYMNGEDYSHTPVTLLRRVGGSNPLDKNQVAICRIGKTKLGAVRGSSMFHSDPAQVMGTHGDPICNTSVIQKGTLPVKIEQTLCFV